MVIMDAIPKGITGKPARIKLAESSLPEMRHGFLRAGRRRWHAWRWWRHPAASSMPSSSSSSPPSPPPSPRPVLGGVTNGSTTVVDGARLAWYCSEKRGRTYHKVASEDIARASRRRSILDLMRFRLHINRALGIRVPLVGESQLVSLTVHRFG